MSDPMNESKITDQEEPDYDDDALVCYCGDRDCPQCGCWQCHGEGWGIIGDDFPNHDPINEPDGEFVRCPNCRGSGKAKDCWYW